MDNPVDAYLPAPTATAVPASVASVLSNPPAAQIKPPETEAARARDLHAVFTESPLHRLGYTALSGVLPDIGSQAKESWQTFWNELSFSKDAQGGVEGALLGIPEAARVLGEGVVGAVGAPLTAMGAESLKLMGADVNVADAIRGEQKLFSYQPTSKVGQALIKTIMLPIEAGAAIGEVAGEASMEHDTPLAATIANSAGQLVGFALQTAAGEGPADALRVKTRAALHAHTDAVMPEVQAALHARDAALAREALPEPTKPPAPEPPAPVSGEGLPIEKRQALDKRARVDSLFAQGKNEEAWKLIDTDDLTGLPTRAAFDKQPPASVYAFVDADGLKWINDTYGHAAGDELLRRIGTGLKDTRLDAYRMGQAADEFVVGGDSDAQLNAGLHQAVTRMAAHPFEDGTAPSITWGIGENLKAAEMAMRKQKIRRESLGKRAARGAQPPDFKGKDFKQLVDAGVSPNGQPGGFADLETPEELRAPESEPAATPALETPLSPAQFEALIMRSRAERKALGNPGLRALTEKWQRTFPSKAGKQEYPSALMVQAMVRAQLDANILKFGHAARVRAWARFRKGEGLYQYAQVQRGDTAPLTGPMGPILKFYLAQGQKMYDMMLQSHVEVQFRNNWLSQYWLNWDEIDSKFLEPESRDTFLHPKQRAEFARRFNDVSEGMAAGGIPFSENPEDLFMKSVQGMQGLLAKDYAFTYLRDNHMINPGNEAPPGFAVKVMPDGRSYTLPKQTLWALENGFYSEAAFPWFKYWMGAKNLTTVPVLGVNLYHGARVEFTVRPADAEAEALRITFEPGGHTNLFGKLVNVIGRNIPGAKRGVAVVKSLRHPKHLPAALAAIDPVWDTRVRALNRAMEGDVADMDAYTAERLEDSVIAGFSGLDPDWRNMSGQAWLRSWSEGNLGGLAAHSIPAAMRLLQKPIMDDYLPYMKTYAFLRHIDALRASDPELTVRGPKQTLAFSRVRRNLDQRLGEMTLDKEFWNPLVTKLLKGAFLSYGWNYGLVAQFGGSVLDAGRITLGKGADLARHIARNTSEAKARRYIGSRLAYSLLLPAYGMALNALLGYVLTGHKPDSFEDFVYPACEKEADGTVHRCNSVTVTSQAGQLYYHLRYQGLIGGSQVLLQNRAAPLLSMLAEQVQNRNFYGQALSDPLDPVWDRYGERIKAAFIKMTPMALQAYIDNAPPPGQRSKAAVLDFIGLTPVAHYVDNTSLVNKIYALEDVYNTSTTPYEDISQQQAKQRLRSAYATHDLQAYTEQLTTDAQKFKWSDRQIEDFEKTLLEPPAAGGFKSLPPRAQLDLLEGMSQAERSNYLPYAAAKAQMLWYSRHP